MLADREWEAICDNLKPDDSNNYTFPDDTRDFCESVDGLLPLLEAAKSSGPKDSGVRQSQGARKHYRNVTRRRHRIYALVSGFTAFRDVLMPATGRPAERKSWAVCAARYNEVFCPRKPMTGNALSLQYHRGCTALNAMGDDWENKTLPAFEELRELHERGLMCNGTSWICPARVMLNGTAWCALAGRRIGNSGCIILHRLIDGTSEGG